MGCGISRDPKTEDLLTRVIIISCRNIIMSEDTQVLSSLNKVRSGFFFFKQK